MGVCVGWWGCSCGGGTGGWCKGAAEVRRSQQVSKAGGQVGGGGGEHQTVTCTGGRGRRWGGRGQNSGTAGEWRNRLPPLTHPLHIPCMSCCCWCWGASRERRSGESRPPLPPLPGSSQTAVRAGVAAASAARGCAAESGAEPPSCGLCAVVDRTDLSRMLFCCARGVESA